MLGEHALKRQRRNRTAVVFTPKPRKAVAIVNRKGVLSIKHNLGPKWSIHRFGSQGLNAFQPKPTTFQVFYQSCRNNGYDEYFCARYAKRLMRNLRRKGIEIIPGKESLLWE